MPTFLVVPSECVDILISWSNWNDLSVIYSLYHIHRGCCKFQEFSIHKITFNLAKKVADFLEWKSNTPDIFGPQSVEPFVGRLYKWLGAQLRVACFQIWGFWIWVESTVCLLVIVTV